MDAPPTGERRYVVPASLHEERLDRVLATLVASTSRSKLQRLIRECRVQVNGEVVRRANRPVAAGAELQVDFPGDPTPVTVEGRPISDLDVIHEDEHLVVIDKPAGLLVHPNDRQPSGSVADLAVARYGPLPQVQGEDRPGIVHRLDRMTSGVMLLGRSGAALEALRAQFQARTVEKTYLAVCHGQPRFDSEWIDAPLGPDPRGRDRFRVVAPEEGRAARTFVECLERFHGFSSLAAHPQTGRTHQIRVHLQHKGWAIVGDRVYRHPGALAVPLPPEAPGMERQALHARAIAFDHPQTGKRLRFEAPLPADMTRLLTYLREREAGCEGIVP